MNLSENKFSNERKCNNIFIIKYIQLLNLGMLTLFEILKYFL